MQLVEDIPDVELDGSFTDAEDAGDLLVGETPQKEIQHLALARGQRCLQGRGAVLGIKPHPTDDNRRRKPKLPLGHLAYRPRQVFFIVFIGHHAPHTPKEPAQALVLVAG